MPLASGYEATFWCDWYKLRAQHHPKEDRIRGGGVDMVKGGGRSTPKTRKCRDCEHQPAQKVIHSRCPVCHGVMRVVRYD